MAIPPLILVFDGPTKQLRNEETQIGRFVALVTHSLVLEFHLLVLEILRLILQMLVARYLLLETLILALGIPLAGGVTRI